MVYPRIDNLTCVHYDLSIRSIFKIYGIPDKYLSLDLAKIYKTTSSNLPSHRMNIKNILFDFRPEDIVKASDDFFDNVYSSIRVEFTGTGLRNYRCMGGHPETDFFDLSYFGNPGSFSLTRMDFAFDFVNMGDEFPYQLIDYLFNYHAEHRKDHDGNTISVTGTNRKVAYSYVVSTAYIGSHSNGKSQFIRVYDKLLETKDNFDLLEAYTSEFSAEGEIQSWFRVELQARRDYVPKILLKSDGKIDNVLRYIFDYFKLVDDNGEVPEFILTLFDWESVYQLLQVSDFIQLDKPIPQKVESVVLGNCRNSIVSYIAMFDDPYHLYSELNYSIICDALIDTPYHKRRFQKYKLQLDALCTDLQIPDCENRFSKLPGITIFNHSGVEIPLYKYGLSPMVLLARFQKELTS